MLNWIKSLFKKPQNKYEVAQDVLTRDSVVRVGISYFIETCKRFPQPKKPQNPDMDCFPVTDKESDWGPFIVNADKAQFALDVGVKSGLFIIPPHVRYAQDFECQNLVIAIAKAKRAKKKFSHLAERLEARKKELVNG